MSRSDDSSLSDTEHSTLGQESMEHIMITPLSMVLTTTQPPVFNLTSASTIPETSVVSHRNPQSHNVATPPSNAASASASAQVPTSIENALEFEKRNAPIYPTKLPRHSSTSASAIHRCRDPKASPRGNPKPTVTAQILPNHRNSLQADANGLVANVTEVANQVTKLIASFDSSHGLEGLQ